MDVRIDVTNAAQISAAFARAPEMVLDELETTMGNITAYLARESAENTPTAAGTLRSGWITRVDVIAQLDAVYGRVTNPLSYALPVELGTMDFMQTENLITKLMGKGEAAARRELMELHGDAVEIDI